MDRASTQTHTHTAAGQMPAPGTLPSPGSDFTPTKGKAGQLINQVTAAVQYCCTRGVAPLFAVRSYLIGVGIVDRAAQDAAILAARNASLITWTPFEGPAGGVLEEERAAWFIHAGEAVAFLSLKSSTP